MSPCERLFAVPFAVLIAAGVAASCGSDATSEHSQRRASAARPTGVLLISVDSLRADHLSCYGYESPLAPEIATSPNIDRRLAAEGTQFQRVVSTTSWTVPAHMALLSGQPDEIHGVKKASSRLHRSRPLLAQRYQAAGWRTAGFFSGPNLHAYFGFGRGFEVYEDCTSVGVDASRFSAGKVEQRREMEDAAHRGHTGEIVVDRFRDWFEALNGDEPFFAFVHFWDVHYDYEPPTRFDVFDPDYHGEAVGRDIPDLVERDLPGRERDTQHIAALYDGEILYTDDNVSQLLDALQAAGRLDDTLVVFTADHGEEFADHGRFGHNKTLYEEVLRVPLILRHPGVVPAGKKVDDLVSLVDIAPTLLDLCGLQEDDTHWGRSLTPLLDGTGLPVRAAPLALQFGRPTLGSDHRPMEGLHAGDHKILRNRPKEAPVLFDLDADPGEQTALKLGKGDPRLGAAKRLWKKLAEEGECLPSADGQLPKELEEELRRIGYMGEEE